MAREQRPELAALAGLEVEVVLVDEVEHELVRLRVHPRRTPRHLHNIPLFVSKEGGEEGSANHLGNVLGGADLAELDEAGVPGHRLSDLQPIDWNILDLRRNGMQVWARVFAVRLPKKVGSWASHERRAPQDFRNFRVNEIWCKMLGISN